MLTSVAAALAASAAMTTAAAAGKVTPEASDTHPDGYPTVELLKDLAGPIQAGE